MNNFEKSKSGFARLELTSMPGCGKMCDYCPQDEFIKQFKKLKKLDKNYLSFELIQNIFQNIDIPVVISHTGFTEPLDGNDFYKIAQFFAEKKIRQTISTTLTGKPYNINYLIENMQIFNESITLHLPDNQGLMKGKFDSSYNFLLKKFLYKYELLISNKVPILVSLFLIGDNFHQSIDKTITEFQEVIQKKYKIQNDFIQKAKYLNTRAGKIDVNRFGKKATQIVRQKNTTYFCGYQRLNRGVLLPNGDVVICSQDYSLETILGNLQTKKLSEIYLTIENNENMKNSFLNGTFKPCINCEHYLPINYQPSGNRIF